MNISMNGYILPYFEWEVMREPITIPKVDYTEELPEGQKEIVINRDEYYNLRAVLSTEGHPTSSTKYGFVESFEITGSNSRDLHCILESCHCAGYTGQGRSDEVDLYIQGLKIRHQTETEGVWLTEWYINGPKNNFVFRNSTTRKMLRKISRERLARNDEKIHSTEIVEEIPGPTSSDYIRIETDDIQFLIVRVPDGFGPNWHSNISSNIGIEYRKDCGRIPDENERETIRELCSFIFGRQLLIVGHTSYDEDDNIVEEYACDPWGNDPRYLCSKPDIPPIRIDGHSKADDLISQLLPPYCELRDRYRLNDALWAYWLARDMPAGMGLPFLAAGVEAVMQEWFDTNNTETRLFSWDAVPGNDDEILLKFLMNYLNICWVKNAKIYKSYDKKTIHINKDGNSAKIRIVERSEKLTIEISDCRTPKLEFKEISVKKLKVKKENGKLNIYKPSRFNKGLKIFFEEINLDIDKNERNNIIKARGKVVHGGFITAVDQKKRRRMIQCGFAYETIVHKILLRLLKYSGRYIDYSDGCKDKSLDSKRDQVDAR